ncbi:MAG: alternative ribosome rescue aminoacyl-tRNA hydrolase ArfB [Rhizomicrobium sp.]|jgi:ribosome-associated protein
MGKIRITAHIAIDESEIKESFVLAAGPGGQNVNKVASAVQLRFDVGRSPSLLEPVRQRLAALVGHRLTKDGVLVLMGRQFRDQIRNRAEVRERLVSLIRAAAVTPKKRRPTKPPRAAKEKRLQHKKKHAELKRARAKPHGD